MCYTSITTLQNWWSRIVWCVQNIFSKVSKEKALSLCSTSCTPIGLDDPQSKGDIDRLIIDLFNGAHSMEHRVHMDARNRPLPAAS